MPIATNEQVQAMSAQARRLAEAILDLEKQINDWIGAAGDTYEHLTQQSPTWTDTHDSNPPNYLTVNDLLALNTLFHNVSDEIGGNAQRPIAAKARVRFMD
jgi:hypothetical protein